MAHGRGKKTNNNKNHQAHADWVAWKKSRTTTTPIQKPADTSVDFGHR